MDHQDTEEVSLKDSQPRVAEQIQIRETTIITKRGTINVILAFLFQKINVILAFKRGLFSMFLCSFSHFERARPLHVQNPHEAQDKLSVYYSLELFPG